MASLPILLVGWILASTLANAQGGSATPGNDLYVSLHYETTSFAQACWNEWTFRESVTQRVGYDPFRDNAPISISIKVANAARSTRGQVEWVNAEGVAMGERRFAASDGNCVKMLREMSFAISLQIQLLRTETNGGDLSVPSSTEVTPSVPAPNPNPRNLAPAASVPAPSSPPETVSLPGSSAAVASAPETSATQRQNRQTPDPGTTPRNSKAWALWLGGGTALAFGIAPSATTHFGLFLAARRDRFSMEFGANASYPSTQRTSDATGFREYLLGIHAALCAHRRALSACALVKASQIRVVGFGVDQPRSPTALVGHTGLRAAATATLGGPWFMTTHLDALLLLTPRIVQVNHATAWEMPRFGALAGIDAVARF